MQVYLLTSVIAFLAANIPVGLIIGKLVKGIDIRQVGSGNIGTANVFRALGFFWATVVLLLDMGKGILGSYLGSLWPQHQALGIVFCGIMAILGHNYSLFLKFKGGKGIATSLGVLVFLDWRIALIGFVIWAILTKLTKISALGSLLAAMLVPVFMWLFHKPVEYLVFGILACLLAIVRHKENIRRLLKKEENTLSR